MNKIAICVTQIKLDVLIKRIGMHLAKSLFFHIDEY